MPDATERGGALASIYRNLKKKGSEERVSVDRDKMVAEAKKNAVSKGDGRNKPGAKKQ
jgi:hypothetical protein